MTMVIRGITQVLNISLSAAANAVVSEIAGIGHILTDALLVSFKKAAVIISENHSVDSIYITLLAKTFIVFVSLSNGTSVNMKYLSTSRQVKFLSELIFTSFGSSPSSSV